MGRRKYPSDFGISLKGTHSGGRCVMHKRHSVSVAASAALLLIAAIGFVGCDDTDEEGRVTVNVTLNEGGPIESDVTDGGVVFEDFIPADFWLRPFNEFITAPRG